MALREMLLSVVAVLLSMGSAFSADAQLRAGPSSNPAEPWLELRYGGTQMSGPYGKGETLTVDDDGRAVLTLASPRENGYIGVFERKLSSDEVALWKERLVECGVEDMGDVYAASPEDGEGETWLRLSVRVGDRRKCIEAWASSMLYPRGLELLFDMNQTASGSTQGSPAGDLSYLMEELSRHPKAAVGASVEVPKREWRVGEAIQAEVVITNVGVASVVLPLPATDGATGSFIHVGLGDPDGRPSEPYVEASVPLGRPRAEDGPGPAGQPRGREQVKVIAPGEAWRIPLPPLPGVTERGTYWLGGYCRLDERWRAGPPIGGLGTPMVGQFPIRAAELRIVEE